MIGEIIREIRQNVNMTQDEMAQALYVTRQAVSRWESDETTPNIETLKQISKMFGVSLNRLLATAQSTDAPTAEINADRFIGFAGLSTRAWSGKCGKVVGIEPSDDMLNIAKAKSGSSASFVKAR